MRRKISNEMIANDPYVFWNQFVDMMAMEDYGTFDELQKKVNLIYVLDSECQNGGIFQYFDNEGLSKFDDLIDALKFFNLDEYITYLSRIMGLRNEIGVTNVDSDLEFVQKALVEYGYEFESDIIESKFDRIVGEIEMEYNDIKPEIMSFLEIFVSDNIDKFFELV